VDAPPPEIILFMRGRTEDQRIRSYGAVGEDKIGKF
jgi:hypothetical protein